MAISKRQETIMKELRTLNGEITARRAKIKDLRKEYDEIHAKRQAEHRLSKMSDAEKAALKDMLVKR